MGISSSSVLKQVRDMMPNRPVTIGEAYIISERQATALLKLLGIRRIPVDVNRIGDLPRVTIDVRPRHEMPELAGSDLLSEIAGISHRLEKSQWHITINGNDTVGRRRFSLSHEVKHVIDYPARRITYAQLSERQIERICDHFAACFLMPRVALKKAWASGIQDVEALAGLFNTSRTAMRIRLNYLGLTNEPKLPITDYFTRSVGPPSLAFDLDFCTTTT